MHLAPPGETGVGEAWLESCPYVREKLERGALHADIGCGAGATLVALARSFPRSRFVGFDSSAIRLEQAQAAIRAARLADRVRLQLLRISRGLPPSFDVATAFDVTAHPGGSAALVRAVHEALEPDGAAVLGGVPEPRARELCLDAGFSLMRRLPPRDPPLFEVRP